MKVYFKDAYRNIGDVIESKLYLDKVDSDNVQKQSKLVIWKYENNNKMI